MPRFNESNLIKQNFTLPSNIIWYICKESEPTYTVLFKLYNSCKYFWAKTKILPVYRLWKRHYGTNPLYLDHKKEKWPEYCTNKEELAKNNIKLFIYEEFYFGDSNENCLSTLLLTFRFELKVCEISHQILALEELKILVKNVVQLTILRCKILKTETNEASLDEIIVIPSNLNKFTCVPSKNLPSSTEIFKKLCALKLKTKLQQFGLIQIPNTMDPKLFSQFIKANVDFNGEFIQFFLSWQNKNEEWYKNFANSFKNEIKKWYKGYFQIRNSPFECIFRNAKNNGNN